MCGMLIAIGKVNLGPLIEGAILMAKDQIKEHEYNKEKEIGSYTHPDGWGIAYLNNKNKWIIKKSIKPIFDDPETNKLKKIKARMAIIHARQASIGELTIENNQPFITTKKGKYFLFAHNGTTRDKISHSSEFIPKGTTDSERLFYSILSDLDEKDTINSIKSNLQQYKDVTKNNLILVTPKRTYVSVNADKAPLHNQMRLLKHKEMVVVSSNAFPTKIKKENPPAWKEIEFGDSVIIENDKLEVTIIKENK